MRPGGQFRSISVDLQALDPGSFTGNEADIARRNAKQTRHEGDHCAVCRTVLRGNADPDLPEGSPCGIDAHAVKRIPAPAWRGPDGQFEPAGNNPERGSRSGAHFGAAAWIFSPENV
jgi:hypothetical protein